MEFRIVIAGCRYYEDYNQAKIFIDNLVDNLKSNYDIIIVSGGCKGADAIGERYAIENGYKIQRILADWERYGKGAGPKRNEKMAEIADLVICFWDNQSKGTKSMIDFATRLNKPVKIKIIKADKHAR